MKTVFKLADKVAAFKAKLELWVRRVNRGIFDMFQTLAGMLGETEPEHSFSQLVHDHLSMILKESSTTSRQQKTHELVRNGSATHLSTNQANIACLCKKINRWILQMTAALKLRSRKQLCQFSGIKSWQNTPKLPPQHLNLYCHFRQPICVKRGFLP
ncbi:uncharacterized protein TNCV_1262451 [Trichonephila clavipes]|nr:uncharacterized protein TNCV_1262451 [Trichonephila clavipes]